MKTATLLKVKDGRFPGQWRFYRLSEPLDGHTLVAVSAVEYVGTATYLVSGPETYIFPADESCDVADWGELDGSYKGGTDHAKALANAGYTVAQEVAS